MTGGKSSTTPRFFPAAEKPKKDNIELTQRNMHYMCKNLVPNNHTVSVTVFSKYEFPRLEIGQPNFDFYQFSYRERLVHSKKHLKRRLRIEFEENRYSHFCLRET